MKKVFMKRFFGIFMAAALVIGTLAVRGISVSAAGGLTKPVKVNTNKYYSHVDVSALGTAGVTLKLEKYVDDVKTGETVTSEECEITRVTGVTLVYAGRECKLVPCGGRSENSVYEYGFVKNSNVKYSGSVYDYKKNDDNRFKGDFEKVIITAEYTTKAGKTLTCTYEIARDKVDNYCKAADPDQDAYRGIDINLKETVEEITGRTDEYTEKELDLMYFVVYDKSSIGPDNTQPGVTDGKSVSEFTGAVKLDTDKVTMRNVDIAKIGLSEDKIDDATGNEVEEYVNTNYKLTAPEFKEYEAQIASEFKNNKGIDIYAAPDGKELDGEISIDWYVVKLENDGIHVDGKLVINYKDKTPVDPTPEDPTPVDPTPEDPTPEDPTPEEPVIPIIIIVTPEPTEIPEEIITTEETETPESAPAEDTSEVVPEEEVEVIEVVEEVETPEGAPEEEEEAEEPEVLEDLEDIETPQGDALPQTGKHDIMFVSAIGAIIAVFGAVLVFFNRRRYF